MTIGRLGYVRIGATDPAQWVGFCCDLLGMEEVEASAEDAKAIKIDDHPFRYLVEPSDTDNLLATGWECDTKADWETAIAALKAAGVDVGQGDGAAASVRNVTDFVSAKDPAGNQLEIYYGRTNVGTAYTPQLGVSGFKTGDMGLGHIVLPAPNQDETHAFYTSILGFRDTDDLSLPPPAEGAPDQRIRFMCANNPRHHSLALYNFPVPSGCVHIMAEVNSLDEVGQALDRITKAGVPLLASLGRHENDEMVSFYAIGPGGIAFEYGYDGKVIDPATYQATTSTLGDVWGHDYQMPGGEG